MREKLKGKETVSLTMLSKEKVIEAMEKMPQKFSVEEAVDELILLEKIEKGLSQSKSNEVIPDSELDEEFTI